MASAANRRRRGDRGPRPDRKAPALPLSPANDPGVLGLAAKLQARFVAESTIESAAGKDSLAETLAICVVRQRMLFQREAAGELDGEVARTLAGIASTIRRLSETLGVATPAPEELDDL